MRASQKEWILRKLIDSCRLKGDPLAIGREVGLVNIVGNIEDKPPCLAIGMGSGGDRKGSDFRSSGFWICFSDKEQFFVRGPIPHRHRIGARIGQGALVAVPCRPDHKLVSLRRKVLPVVGQPPAIGGPCRVAAQTSRFYSSYPNTSRARSIEEGCCRG